MLFEITSQKMGVGPLFSEGGGGVTNCNALVMQLVTLVLFLATMQIAVVRSRSAGRGSVNIIIGHAAHARIRVKRV